MCGIVCGWGRGARGASTCYAPQYISSDLECMAAPDRLVVVWNDLEFGRSLLLLPTC